MKTKAIIFITTLIMLLSVPFVNAVGWQLKDMGVGIFVYDPAKYDKELQIVEKRNSWSLKDLRERNAFS